MPLRGRFGETIMTMIDERDNVAVWFEIPAVNFERAARFYETIFNARLRLQTIGGQKMGVFPYERPSVSGCVMEAPALAGQDTGTIVYLNCNGQLEEVLERVERAGGVLLTPRVELPTGMGAYFHIRDSEGNRVGLHAVS
jgi:predicted enzyme related to lactoylglutathione lyase